MPKQLLIRLRENDHYKLKLKAAELGIPMQQILESLVKEYLKTK